MAVYKIFRAARYKFLLAKGSFQLKHCLYPSLATGKDVDGCSHFREVRELLTSAQDS